jgi:hypothetical protein
MTWLLWHALYAQDIETSVEDGIIEQTLVSAQLVEQRAATSSAVMETLAFQSLLLDQIKLKDVSGAHWCCGITETPDASVYLLPGAPTSLVVLPGETEPVWVIPAQEDKAAPDAESP